MKGFIFALDYNGLHIESGEKKPSRLPSGIAFNIPAEHEFYVVVRLIALNTCISFDVGNLNRNY